LRWVRKHLPQQCLPLKQRQLPRGAAVQPGQAAPKREICTLSFVFRGLPERTNFELKCELSRIASDSQDHVPSTSCANRRALA
jgi:hypothetical protein